MPTVENTMQLPGKGAARGRIRIRLITKTLTDPGEGFKASTRTSVSGVINQTSDAKGYWSVDLEANADLTPVNSYYEVTEDAGPGAAPVVNYIIVPTGAGPHWIKDILKP